MLSPPPREWEMSLLNYRLFPVLRIGRTPAKLIFVFRDPTVGNNCPSSRMPCPSRTLNLVKRSFGHVMLEDAPEYDLVPRTFRAYLPQFRSDCCSLKLRLPNFF